MNIGSRPSKRKPSGGIESLRAIPWIFAWTQTRFHLPVWLGFGEAFKHAIEKDPKNLQMLQDMYNQWPFFRVTIDLVEMVFAKGDPGIASLYDKLLVSKELCPFGERLRSKYEETKSFLLKVISNCFETSRFGMFVHLFVAVSNELYLFLGCWAQGYS
jgi:phosphoenolpyruvate carboxylase